MNVNITIVLHHDYMQSVAGDILQYTSVQKAFWGRNKAEEYIESQPDYNPEDNFKAYELIDIAVED